MSTRGASPASVTIVVADDDDDDIRGLVRFTLERRGHTVVEARDGVEAIARIGDFQPRLVVLDVMMPKLNGFEAFKQLQQDPTTRDIPVVFLSAKGQKVEVDEGLQLGAAGYVVKPFEPRELANYIEEILESLAT